MKEIIDGLKKHYESLFNSMSYHPLDGLDKEDSIELLINAWKAGFNFATHNAVQSSGELIHKLMQQQKSIRE